MDMAKAGRIVKVCHLVAQMPSGAGWVKPSEIIQWSSVPQATTYRYLDKLQKLGYLKGRAQGYRKGIIRHYQITDAGIDFLKSFKEMF